MPQCSAREEKMCSVCDGKEPQRCNCWIHFAQNIKGLRLLMSHYLMVKNKVCIVHWFLSILFLVWWVINESIRFFLFIKMISTQGAMSADAPLDGDLTLKLAHCNLQADWIIQKNNHYFWQDCLLVEFLFSCQSRGWNYLFVDKQSWTFNGCNYK